MSAFTDEDLKQLKEHYPCGMCPDNDQYIPALIARLEAAERDLMAYETLFKKLLDEKQLKQNKLAYVHELLTRLELWRKAAGK